MDLGCLQEEVYETQIGMFKVIEHNENSDLLNVLAYIPDFRKGTWEDMGFMKRKDFFNLIKNHNPQKKTLK